MDLTIQMRKLNYVKDHHAICLKFGDRIRTSLSMLEPEAKANICSIIKKAKFYIVVSLRHLLSLS